MGQEADDLALIEAWRSGDGAAGERLFRRHFKAVSRFFRNKFSVGIDDLIQRTFVGLIEGRDRLQANRSFNSYLFGIAHNVMRAHLRVLDRDQKFDPVTNSIIQLDPGPSTMLAEHAEQRLLLRALRRIPLEYQIVLELTYWEGLDAADLAGVFEVPHSTMRSRVQRARAVLEDAINELSRSVELRQSTLDGLERWATEIRKFAPAT